MAIQYNQVNDVTTTLNGSITAGATSITVNSGGSFPAVPFAIRIDSEIMQVTSIGSGTNWTVTRASESVNGAATAASHANGATVFQMATAAAWNALVQLQTGTNTPQTGGISVSGRADLGGTSLNDIGAYVNNSGNFAAVNATNNTTGANSSGHGVYGSTNSTSSTAAGVFGINSGSGNGGEFDTGAGAAYGMLANNTTSSDGAGAAVKADGGSHTIGLIAVTNHATKEVIKAINAGTGPGVNTNSVQLNGVTYLAAGTSFPGSPVTGQQFYRTDLNLLAYYDGTRWLTTHEYTTDYQVSSAGYTATFAVWAFAPFASLYAVRLELFHIQTVNGSGTVKDDWTEGSFGIASGVVTSSGATANVKQQITYTSFTNNPVDFSSTAAGRSILTFTRTGNPGTVTAWATLTYRKVLT